MDLNPYLTVSKKLGIKSIKLKAQGPNFVIFPNRPIDWGVLLLEGFNLFPEHPIPETACESGRESLRSEFMGSVDEVSNNNGFGCSPEMEKFLCERLGDPTQPISERFRVLFSLRNLKGPAPRNALIRG